MRSRFYPSFNACVPQHFNRGLAEYLHNTHLAIVVKSIRFAVDVLFTDGSTQSDVVRRRDAIKKFSPVEIRRDIYTVKEAGRLAA